MKNDNNQNIQVLQKYLQFAGIQLLVQIMKNVIVILSVLTILGCKSTTKEKLEWIKASNSADFAEFFKFGLVSNNSELMSFCADSLTKFQPDKSCIVLRYVDTWDSDKDSLVHKDFFLDDQCDWDIDYKFRNIVIGLINENDSILVKYQNSEFDSFEGILQLLHDTLEESYDVPQIIKVNFNGIEFKGRSVATFIYTKRLPDSLPIKTSWTSIINATNEILETKKLIRNEKSIEIFGKALDKLDLREKGFIYDLIPIYINIYFDSPFALKPPPPPAPQEGDEILENIEIDEDLL